MAASEEQRVAGQNGAQDKPAKLPRRRSGAKLRTRASERTGRPPTNAFKKGTNSVTGEVFRRGADLIPRGTFGSIYRAILEDDGTLARALAEDARRRDAPALAYRVQLARAILRSVRSTPRTAMAVAEQMADRLEGTPVRKVETVGRRSVVFYNSAGPLPPQLVGPSSTPPGPHDVEPPSIAAAPPTEPTAKRLPEHVIEIARAGTEEPAP